MSENDGMKEEEKDFYLLFIYLFLMCVVFLFREELRGTVKYETETQMTAGELSERERNSSFKNT